jgi:divalent metal cation (Fe/Co/Zn/Cd) transporter
MACQAVFLDFNDIDMLVSLISAVMLTFYQRYVGKSNGNLALISQPVDSKNHIYMAGVVILGAIFSIVGIHFVDPLIGVYIGSAYSRMRLHFPGRRSLP